MKRKTPSSRQSRRKFLIKVAHGSTSKTGGLYNRRTELKTLDATISARFSTTANFTLFNAVRLGPDDFNVLVKKLRCIVSFSEAVLLIVLLQPELVIVLIFCVCWSFYDRQSNGTLPAISDILAMRDLAGAVTTTSDHQK